MANEPAEPAKVVEGAAGDTDDASQDKQGGVSRAIEDIESFAESGSTAALEKALDAHLSGPLSEDTFRAVRDAGMLIVGDDGFSLVVWVASKPEQAKALNSLDLSLTASTWLKSVIATYGERLNRALHKSDVLASKRDDWEAFGWSLRIDPADGEYEITTEIEKYNGDKLVLKAGLRSSVRLAERILEPLLSVESLRSVSDEDQRNLLKAITAVQKKLNAERAEADDKDS